MKRLNKMTDDELWGNAVYTAVVIAGCLRLFKDAVIENSFIEMKVWFEPMEKGWAFLEKLQKEMRQRGWQED